MILNAHHCSLPSSHSGCQLRHSAHIELVDDREKEGPAYRLPCHSLCPRADPSGSGLQVPACSTDLVISGTAASWS